MRTLRILITTALAAVAAMSVLPAYAGVATTITIDDNFYAPTPMR
jgi:hypothetical protein